MIIEFTHKPTGHKGLIKGVRRCELCGPCTRLNYSLVSRPYLFYGLDLSEYEVSITNK